MTTIDDRFRALRERGAPDLWDEIAHREPRPARAPSQAARYGAAAVALVLAVAGFAVVVRAFRDDTTSRPAQQAEGVTGPLDPRVTAEIPVDAVVTELAVDGELIWAGGQAEDGEPYRVMRIDPSTNEIVAWTDVDVPPWEMAAGSGSLWITGNANGPDQVQRIDAATGEVALTITVGRDDTGPIAIGEGAVWVTAWESDVALEKDISQVPTDLLRIDPSTGDIVARISLDEYIDGSISEISAGGGSVWVQEMGGPPAGEGCADLIRIDPFTNQVVQAIPASGLNMAAGLESIWVSCRMDRTEYVAREVDIVTGAVSQAIDLPDGQFGPLAVTDEGVWFTGYNLEEHVVVFLMDEAGDVIASADPIESYYTAAIFDDVHGAVWVGAVSSVTRIDLHREPAR
jgi:hypothetical protein